MTRIKHLLYSLLELIRQTAGSFRLKDGYFTHNKKLDRIYELDWRSLDYPITTVLTEEQIRVPRSYTWPLSVWLNQGGEGACVGFGTSQELAATPIAVTGVTNQFAREKIYWPAQKIDPWAGGAYPGATPFYEGTSLLAGIKIAAQKLFYRGYRWALSIRDFVSGVAWTGPAVCAFNWYQGMMQTDSNGFIRPTGSIVGGHCIVCIGTKIVWKYGSIARTWEEVDMDQSYLIFQNSWGKLWGQNGRCKLTLRNAERLLFEQGEVCFPLRNPDAKVAV